jgi:Family of unknown function (DUF6600)/FecR protein
MSKRAECALVVMAAMLFAALSAEATSHVRIVRLSYTSGNVQMDRASGQGLERAILNSPIAEGSRIVTGTDGLAEVEFENNSSVRIGDATEVRFRQLLMNDAGDKINEVELVRGTMYFDARSSKGDIYRVVAVDQTFVVQRNSQVRFLTSGNQVQVSVLNGSAQLDNSAQPVTIKKADTLTVDASNPQGFIVAKGVDKLPLDAWNNERAAYQTAYSYNNDPYGSRSLSTFGYQDLAYYGGFMSVPGYGLAWQPYGVSMWAGWDPFMQGAWAFTPGFGYAWASAYPWGWMPYHYGAWAYQPVIGWFWYPGNALNGGGVITNWQATAPVVNGPVGYVPPRPPVTTSATRPTVMVGQVGRMEAYIPGGPIPPNFRSVITDHSGLAGTNSSRPASGVAGGGSSFAAPQSRAMSSANTTRSGHVFVAPPSAFSTWSGYGSRGTGYGSAASPSFGRGGVHMQSTGGMGHAGGTSVGHNGSGGSPK